MRFLLLFLQQLFCGLFVAVAEVLLLLLQGFAVGLVKVLLVLVPALDGLVIEEDVEPAVLVGSVQAVAMKHLAAVFQGLLLEIDGIVMSWRLVMAELLFVRPCGCLLRPAGVVQGLD